MKARERTKEEHARMLKSLGPCSYIEGWVDYDNGSSIYHLCPPVGSDAHSALKNCWWNIG